MKTVFKILSVLNWVAVAFDLIQAAVFYAHNAPAVPGFWLGSAAIGCFWAIVFGFISSRLKGRSSVNDPRAILAKPKRRETTTEAESHNENRVSGSEKHRIKKFLVPAIISAFALSLFDMRMFPATGYESQRLPTSQEKAVMATSELVALIPFNLVPGINLFCFYARLYGQAIEKQNPVSLLDRKAEEVARTVANLGTLLGFFVWAAVWMTVLLLKPKWWYVSLGFVLALGGAVWISIS